MRPDFTKHTVDELRDMYAEKSGKALDEIKALKGKSTLVELLLPYYDIPEEQAVVPHNKPFMDVEPEENSLLVTTSGNNDSPAKPRRGEAGWQEFVLDQLTEDEYMEKDGKKFPKAQGLRRLVEVLLGPIVSSGPKVVFPINNQTDMATVVYEVQLDWMWSGEVRVFSDVADAGFRNTPEEYAKHAAATASSRAAGRTFRNALLLTINTAEEMNTPVGVTNGPTDDIRYLDVVPISSNQITGIRIASERIGVDTSKLLKLCGFDKNIEDLTKSNGLQLLEQLNKYSSTGPDSLSVPDDIKVVLEKGE